MVERRIKKGIYRHFKGNEYEVIGVGCHSETQEEFVIYKPLRGDKKFWIRSLKMFTEKVDKPEYNYKGPRFSYVKEK